MKDVMIDFETLGNGTNKCVCQVGAVYFDNITGELGPQLKLDIDAGSHVKLGGRLDADTVYWWLQQSDAARASIARSPTTLDVTTAMVTLNDFLKDASRIWSHATFDFVTLCETMKQCGVKPSFSYKSGLDLRTLTYLAGTSVSAHQREGVHHDGLADAIFQVKYAVAALNKIKGDKKVLNFVSKILDDTK